MKKRTVHTEISRTKISNYRKGKKHSQETIEKIKAARALQNPPNKHFNYTTSRSVENSLFKRIVTLMGVPFEQREDFINTLKTTTAPKKAVSTLNGTSNKESLTKDVCSIIFYINFKRVLNTKEFKEYNQFWLDLCEKRINLNFTLGEIVELQKTLEAQAQIDIASTNPLERFKYNKSVKHIASLFEDSARRCVGGRQIKLFNKYRPIHKQKNFFTILKLRCVFDTLGLFTDTDRKQYIQGVFDQKQIKRNGNFIPLKTLSSPYCVIDYMFYLKTNWFERYTSSNAEEKYKRERRYGSTYWEEQRDFAVGIARRLISLEWDSRVETEIPMAFGTDDFSLLYCYCSPYISEWFYLCILEDGWREMANKMVDFHQRVKQEPEIEEIVEETERRINLVWEESGIEEYSEDPMDDVRRVAEKFCPNSMGKVEQWALILRTPHIK